MNSTAAGFGIVLPSAVAIAVAGWRVRRIPEQLWPAREMHFAVTAAVLVLPAALVIAVVDGRTAGLGALVLWGVLALITLFAARLDSDDEEELASDTRWLLDATCLTEIIVSVVFAVLDLGSVFIPSAAFVVLTARIAHLRRS